MFDDDSTVPARRPARTRELDHTEELHRCKVCPSTLVYPLDWAEAGPRHWEITLRCPNCERIDTGVFDGAAVERFDSELDRATESMIDDLRRLMHANMEEDIERFTAALYAGYVVADDF